MTAATAVNPKEAMARAYVDLDTAAMGAANSIARTVSATGLNISFTGTRDDCRCALIAANASQRSISDFLAHTDFAPAILLTGSPCSSRRCAFRTLHFR